MKVNFMNIKIKPELSSSRKALKNIIRPRARVESSKKYALNGEDQQAETASTRCH